MAKVYKKGKYGTNVVVFQHPYCYQCEVTGLWINERKLPLHQRLNAPTPQLSGPWPRSPGSE